MPPILTALEERILGVLGADTSRDFVSLDALAAELPDDRVEDIWLAMRALRRHKLAVPSCNLQAIALTSLGEEALRELDRLGPLP